MNTNPTGDSGGGKPDAPTLLALTVPPPGTLAALHHRLEREAERSGILDVAYRTIDTPVGEL
ncbi:MAG: hypothetical protein ACRDQZ_02090, partial [Mycobacteriales bacterium]